MKIFKDGSTYDSRNGYRSAEVVKQQEEDGTFIPPGLTDKERSNLKEGVILLLGIIIIVALTWASILFTSMKNESDNNKVTIENSITSSQMFGPNVSVLSQTKDSVIIHAGGSVIKCDVSYVHNEEKSMAYVFCGDVIAVLSVQL